jgi:hypothetical protein
MKLHPGYSSAVTRTLLAAVDPDFRERYIDGLWKAGLRE